MRERARERERPRARKRVSPPAARMFVARRIGGKEVEEFQGGVQVLRAGNGGEGRKNPNNHHGK